MLSGKDANGDKGGGRVGVLKEWDREVYDLVSKGGFEGYHEGLLGALREADGEVYELIEAEYERLCDTLILQAAENRCSRAVLAALGSVVQNKTVEGFAGARMHGGCAVVDEIERLAVSRAKEAFGAKYANVQPHSGTAANQIVITAVLESGDRILSLGPGHGGHYSHGANVSFTGKFFEVGNYYVDEESFLLDYEAIGKKAVEFGPKLIICGASTYSRVIDFARFREIADGVGAYLMADISHISGLVMAGAHPSPIELADFTTTSTYKSGGPRGGLILMGEGYDRKVEVCGEQKSLWEHIEAATFPGMQGTSYLNHIAAKAVFFKEALSEEYKSRQFRIIENARRLARGLISLGYDVLTGGTDNHLFLVNVANSREGLTGVIAQKALEECGIVVDMVGLPYDKRLAGVGSGIRFGTPIVTRIRMGENDMEKIAGMVDAVLKEVVIVGESEYRINEAFRDQMREQVRDFCRGFSVR
jgi:glycine hydroxymethyltransferase